ncbi:adenylate cyclase type 1, partial [Pelobates cultripes]
VTEDVQRILKKCNYEFVCRGTVSVKGKGEMLTYFLEGKVNGMNLQTRSLNLERKMYPYGKANIHAKLGISCPSVANLTANALDPMPDATSHANQGLKYLPSISPVVEI